MIILPTTTSLVLVMKLIMSCERHLKRRRDKFGIYIHEECQETVFVPTRLKLQEQQHETRQEDRKSVV